MKYIFIAMLVWVTPLAHALQQASIDMLGSPTLLLAQGRYAQASNSFHNQANKTMGLERQLGREQMWQTAGLLEALAAMSAEKVEDPTAYEYWSNSVRYFLISGSSWEELRLTFRQSFEQSNSRVAAGSIQGDIGYDVDDQWLQLLSLIEIWESKLGFFGYDSPKPGLMTKQAQPSSGIPRSASGQQLKQYSPNSKLMIGNSFSSKQTFIVAPTVTQNEKQEVEEGSVLTSPSQEANDLEDQTVIATSIEEPLNVDESESEALLSSEANKAQEAQTISRGNNSEGNLTQPVQATQRRSFAPVIDESQN